ncbi:MAG: hypothetical protein R6U96_14370, partial [Promethearchaeia archaeon]
MNMKKSQDHDAKFIEVNIKPSKYTKSTTDIFLEGKATTIFTKLDDLTICERSPHPFREGMNFVYYTNIFIFGFWYYLSNQVNRMGYELDKGAHSVYSLNYHYICCVKS